MSLEQQLREALRDVAARLHPDPARAYERFRRRRLRRRVLAVPAFAVTTIAAVLLASVAVAQLRPEPSPPATPSPAPTPTTPPPLEFEPGPRTAEIPAAGFAIEVPAGWEVATVMPGGDELRLRPESEPRAGIQVSTIALQPELGPGKGEAYPDDLHRPTVGFHSPSGPHEYSRRPDGRRVLKAGQAATDASYYVAWPYYCTSEQPGCLDSRLRTLMVRFFAPEAAWPEVREVGESIVANARPITNALEGGDQSTPRDACRGLWDGSKHNGPTEEATVVFQVAFRNSRVMACDAHLELTLQVIENGRLAQVFQSPGPPMAVIDGRSPEEVARPADSTAVAWRWMNWCGERDAELQLVVNGEVDPLFQPGGPGAGGPTPPPCTHPDDPSTIELLSFEQ